MKALYPGRFDPPHLGHLDLIRRAAKLADELVVGVVTEPGKPAFLPAPRRVALLHAACAGLTNVSVVAYRGATVAFARKHGVTVLVRGLRGAADLEAERVMAEVNRANGFDTLFLASAVQHIHLSSSMVRRVVELGLPLTGLVPAGVAKGIKWHTGRE
jgi:pantetheine-phosphate adenylyltransferase